MMWSNLWATGVNELTSYVCCSGSTSRSSIDVYLVSSDVQALGVYDTLTATHAGVVTGPVGVYRVDQGDKQSVLYPQVWLVKEQVCH